MTRKLALCLASTLLAGCGTHEGGGGLETGDLTARVVTPTGEPAARARVWLVESLTDSAPAHVLDSALTDSSGQARFHLPNGHSRTGLGLDSRSDTAIGIVPGALSHSDTGVVQLAPIGQALIQSTGKDPVVLFVPGSHFVSALSDEGNTAVLELPHGTWTVAKRSSGTTTFSPNRTISDLPDLLAPVLRSTDTLNLGGTLFSRDSSFPAPFQWTRLQESNLNDTLQAALIEKVATGETRFLPDTDPNWIPQAYEGCGIVSPELPWVGAFTWTWNLFSDLSKDSTMIRRAILRDSVGNGIQFNIGLQTKYPVQTFDLGGTTTVLSIGSAISLDWLSSSTNWTLNWNDTSIQLYAKNRLIAQHKLAKPFDTKPYLRFEVVRAANSSSFNWVLMSNPGLYLPPAH